MEFISYFVRRILSSNLFCSFLWKEMKVKVKYEFIYSNIWSLLKYINSDYYIYFHFSYGNQIQIEIEILNQNCYLKYGLDIKIIISDLVKIIMCDKNANKNSRNQYHRYCFIIKFYVLICIHDFFWRHIKSFYQWFYCFFIFFFMAKFNYWLVFKNNFILITYRIF